MATNTVSGGQFVFSAAEPVNLRLTPDGSNLPPPIAGDFNLEIFTRTNGTTASDYSGSAFAPGGTLDANNRLIAASLTLNHGNFQVNDFGGGDSILAGSGDQTIVGAAADTIIGGSGTLVATAGVGDTVSVGGGETQATINALAGSDLVRLGAGNATVYAAANDEIDGGGGQATIAANTGEGITVTGGSAFLFPGLTLSNASGTITVAGGGVALVGAAGDTIDTGNDVPSATINALNGPELVTSGANDVTVFAAGGDTVMSGPGQGTILFGAETLSVQANVAAPNFTVAGAAGILLGGADLLEAVGAAGDTIAVGSGIAEASSSTVNAIAGNEVVQIGGHAASVFGGAGDTLGVGPSPGGGDSFLMLHSSLAGAGSSVGFGTFDSVNGSSGDTVQVGTVKSGAAAEGFNTATDFLFYQNESKASTDAVVGSQKATVIGGVASTQFTLPDGTSMTLIGVTAITAGMFR